MVILWLKGLNNGIVNYGSKNESSEEGGVIYTSVIQASIVFAIRQRFKQTTQTMAVQCLCLYWEWQSLATVQCLCLHWEWQSLASWSFSNQRHAIVYPVFYAPEIWLFWFSNMLFPKSLLSAALHRTLFSGRDLPHLVPENKLNFVVLKCKPNFSKQFLSRTD